MAGWVPEQRHDHFDANGVLTGYTIVTTEPRVSDDDLVELLALARFDAEVCSCGYHPSVARDESNYFRPETHKCPVCAGQAQVDRMQRDRDEAHAAAHKNDGPAAPRPGDGRKSYMRLLTAEQVAEERAARTKQ